MTESNFEKRYGASEEKVYRRVRMFCMAAIVCLCYPYYVRK